MNQSKLKKVMRLTQQWIQDNRYKNHAETMQHRQWLQILTVLHEWQPTKFWEFELAFLMVDNTGKLVDIGRRCKPDMDQTTYMFTTTLSEIADTCSTKSSIDLADY